MKMFVAFGWLIGALVVESPVGRGSASPAVPPDEAQRCAQRGVASSPAMFVQRFREARRGASAAAPLLVERLDRMGAAYYLVPFRREGATTLVALVDAGDCRFLEATYMQVPGVYPPISEETAKARVLAMSLLPAERHEVESQRPVLVWQVCEASQSPYEPLWCFRVGPGARYVDQTGAVYDRIEAPRLKGGDGPPGRE